MNQYLHELLIIPLTKLQFPFSFVLNPNSPVEYSLASICKRCGMIVSIWMLPISPVKKISSSTSLCSDRSGDSLGWKFMSCSHCQELCQLTVLASDWLFNLVQPIRSQFACWHNSWQWLQLINFHPWAAAGKTAGFPLVYRRRRRPTWQPPAWRRQFGAVGPAPRRTPGSGRRSSRTTDLK